MCVDEGGWGKVTEVMRDAGRKGVGMWPCAAPHHYPSQTPFLTIGYTG